MLLSAADVACQIAIPIFWSLHNNLSPAALQGCSIALVNSIGNGVGGFLGPWMLGAAGWLGARRKYGYPERAAEPEPHVELGGGAEEGSPVAEGVRTRGARIVPRAEWEEPWAGAQHGTPSAPASGVVRLVVISDTHGMEEQMFAQLTGDDTSVATGEGRSPAALPAGDVLIHCGDWQADVCWISTGLLQLEIS